MSSEEVPQTPPETIQVRRMVRLASEADTLMACVHDRYMTGERKRGMIEESKLRLMELRVLLNTYRTVDMSEADEERYDYALARFRFLRPEQQDIENFLFGAESGPGRYPVIPPLLWGEDTTETIGNGSAAGNCEQPSSAPDQTDTKVEPQSSIDLSDTVPIIFTSDDDLATITYGMFDRTIPTLDIDSRVREDIFSAYSTPGEAVLTATSRENVINIFPVDVAEVLQGSAGVGKKRKYGELQ